MPIVVRKIRKKNLYSVKNKDTGHIHSKGSTLENALKQQRLLNIIDAKKHSPQKMPRPVTSR